MLTFSCPAVIKCLLEYNKHLWFINYNRVAISSKHFITPPIFVPVDPPVEGIINFCNSFMFYY